MSNNGRVAWVTGGGTGIGQACVEMLAARGWSVAVTSRRAENVEAAIASAVRFSPAWLPAVMCSSIATFTR